MSENDQNLIPFAKFMADALYHPKKGYYTANIKTVGRSGDFSTSATVHSALGFAVRRWIDQEAKKQPTIRDVIEVGPGDGSLLSVVRTAAGWLGRRKFRFHLVEKSPVLRAIQKKKLGQKVTHHSDLSQALELAGGRAFIYCNELVDAFPATALNWNSRSSRWDEIWVSSQREDREQFRPFAPPGGLPASSSVLGAWKPDRPPPHPDQRVEIHFAFREWLESWQSKISAGSILTIDYGDRFPEIYCRKPNGSLRAYFVHLVLEGLDIYDRPGRQDLTADVNFTDLENWYGECGWTTDQFETQAEFITRMLGKRLAKWESAKDGDALAQILATPGAGEAFKVLSTRISN